MQSDNGNIAYGGNGNETFIWETGAGNDTINAGYAGSHGQDTLRFENLVIASIAFSIQNQDLLCTNSVTGNGVTVQNWFAGSDFQINTLQFSDQTLTANQVASRIA